MRVIKSLHSGVLHRNLEMDKRELLSVASLWGFQLSTGKPLLEKDLWPCVLEALPQGQALDVGLPKFKAEFLVAGSFLSPEPVPGGTVHVECGECKKSLAVFGDRYWSTTSFEGPEPIAELPLTYEQAFGGENFLSNPVGKGIAGVTYEGVKRYPLPNVEYLDALVSSKNDKPRPASLGNVDVTWQPRSQLAGTYDEEYINRYMPGFPPDMDPTYFCCAAQDQWFEDYPKGGERFRISSMNLEYPELSGILPQINARLFLADTSGSDTKLVELENQIDTVWFFPNQDCGVIIHRGVMELSTETPLHFSDLLIAHENQADTPRDIAHYKDQFIKRTDPEKGAIYSFSTDALIPEGVMCGFKQIMSEAETDNSVARDQFNTYADNQTAKLEAQINEQNEASGSPLSEYGFDGVSISELQSKQSVDDTEMGRQIQSILDKIAPKDPNNPNAVDLEKMDLSAIDELNEYMKSMAEKEEQKAMEGIQERIEQLRAEPSTVGMAEDMERALAERKLPPVLPRIRDEVNAAWASIESQMSETRKNLMVTQSLGVDPAPILAQLNSLNETAEKINESLESAESGYCKSAHFIEESRSPHEGKEPGLVVEFQSLVGSNREFEFVELAFTSLPKLILIEKSFKGGYFEYADLTDSAFENVRFSRAVFAHANFTEAQIVGCTFSECNLGACDFTNARFEQCEFDDTTLGRSRFKGAVFINCVFKCGMDGFLEADLKGSSFSDCEMESCIFNELDMTGCVFERCKLDTSNFVYCQLAGSRFSGSSLNGANLVGAKASGVDFSECSMENIRFVDGCVLSECKFTHATGSLANFRGSQLDKANLSESRFHSCDFSDANLFAANISQASLRLSMFDRANMERASLNRCDAMEASFQEARLVSANFGRANLYGANFYGVEVGETDFRSANLKKTLFKDWRPERG
ncbi:MAG: DUF2169 domain-containing protein [Saccharospirillum sp.]|uniref:DUF2169 family type VI secretion system accessory protein n=1 Tax=Saccharospirillum sp. TaxID=2033801 RepID=UPI00329801E3